jgi:hypothetical protein
LTKVVESLSPEVIDWLAGDRSVLHFQASPATIDQLHELYLTAEEAAHCTKSLRAFSAARFASA